MEYATLTKQNQITVPMKVRDKLKLRPSDKLLFYESEDSIIVTKLKSIEDFKGLLKEYKVELSKQKNESIWLDRYIRYEEQDKK